MEKFKALVTWQFVVSVAVIAVVAVMGYNMWVAPWLASRNAPAPQA